MTGTCACARWVAAGLLLGGVLSASAGAAEIYSNAIGGGAWSDPATWQGGVVPGSEDDVVLASDDEVIFDRHDDAAVSCHQLLLDPRSVLTFKTGAGPITLTVDGLLESYGHIRLDGTRSARDRLELRLAAPEADQRVLRLAQGGSLVAVGRTVRSQGERNVLLTSLPPPVEPATDPSAGLEAQAGTTLDVQRCELANVYLQAFSIDNTGAKPGERINVVRNHFVGTSRLMLSGCDTPLVADNLFERDDPVALQQPAIYLTGCPLAEVRGNTIRGTYAGGITGYGQTETSVTNNLIEKCQQGLYWYGANAMIRKLTIRDCSHGMTLTSASAAAEDVLIEGCLSGYHHGGADVQFTNLAIRNMQPNSPYDINYSSGPLKLLNCPIEPEQIKFDPSFVAQPADGGPRAPTVQSMQFVIVQVAGQAPSGVRVDIRTAAPAVPLAAGALDPNVRNAPAAVLSSGFTPLPKTLEPLIVCGWSYDADAKLVAAPEYHLNVLAPAAGEAEASTVLKTVSITPQSQWYRAQPNDRVPTIEVTLP
jgi:hypothetical protein